MPGAGVPAATPSPTTGAAGALQVSDSLRRFVLFLENFAPLVNSLSLGIANPLLLGPSPLHFAQIKTQLALQQLNAVASHGSAPPYTLLNQAFLKVAMSRPRFNPRGTFPLQRPRAPNPPGMRPPGPFMRPGSMGLPRFYPAGRARGIPHRFPGHESYQNMGPQRMNVQVTQHRTDPRLTKEKMDFHEAQQKKGKPHGSRWDDEPHITPPVGVKQSSVAQVTEQSPKVQSRYTKESASSILASFGLSNEDLEELSRYPDEQLTPENMPLILRDIRMRKVGRRLPNLPSHSRNKETLGKEAVSSNVIDYGHASKYGYTEDPLEVRIYDPEIPTDEVKNEFRSQQNISATVPSSNVISNSVFPVEDVFRQMDFTALSQQERIPQKTVISSTDAHVGSRGSKKSYQSETDLPIRSPFGIVKASWLPKFTQAGAQKMKRLPTPSMMNDYYAASPRIFPHLCSLCNVECSHLKDWIQHQNTSTHIESCRQLRQQYPDWNPEILPSRRNESNRKENETPRRRSHSHSPSPRHSRRSSSSHRYHRSRSPARYSYRPRSRSPRICHRFISKYRSRSRSRSPHRSRNLVRRSPKSYRSVSPERTSRRSVRSDKKKAVEDGGQRSVHGAEVNKQKNIEAVDKGLLPAQKPKLASGAKPSVKSVSSIKSDSHLGEHAAHKVKNLEDDNLPENKPASGKGAFIQRKIRLRKDQSLSSNSILLVSELPEDGFTEEDIRKTFQPFGNISDVLLVPCRNEAYLEMEFRKAVTAVMKYIETTPLEIKGKSVRVCVPGKKKAQNKEMKKKPSDSKKLPASALRKETDASKTIKTVTSAPFAKTGRIKPSTFKVNKFAGKSAGSVKSVVTVAAKGKAFIKTAKAGKKSLEAKKSGIIKNKDSNKLVTVPAKAAGKSAEETTRGTLETTENEPVTKEVEEMSVVFISNLPNKGYSTEKIHDLAKPFGSLKDVVILSSHKKAYIEINKKSADSMVKFYTSFPISMDGNQLSISMAPEDVDIKNEEALFITLIQENNPEANADEIYDRFVHFGNVPEDGLQCVLCVGHQFGKVDRYVFISNKNKVILQLESPESALSMYNFLKQYPQSIGDYVLTCTLSPKMDSEDQWENDPELGKESTFSPDLKNSPVDESEVQTAADSPSVKPSEVEEETTCNIETETSVLQEELDKEESKQALYESDFATETLDLEEQGTEVSVEIPLVASTPANIELFSENMEESALNQQMYTSDIVKEEAEVTNPETELSTSDSVFIEERKIKRIPEDSLSEAEDLFSGIARPMVEAIAEVDKHETVSEVLPSAYVVTQVPGNYIEGEKVVSKKDTSIKGSMDDKEENEFKTKETRMDLQVKAEKAEKNEADTFVEKLEKIIAAIREKPIESAVIKADPNKGVGESSKPDETGKTSVPTISNVCSSKTSIKAAMVSSPKTKSTTSKTESQKNFPKPLLRDQINAEKKVSAKEFGLLKNTRSDLAESNSKAKSTQSGVNRGCSGRISALQCKDSKLDYKDITKQSQETETKPPIMKRDDSNNKALALQNTRNSKNTTGRSSKSKEEPLFTFNLDEFVTVDEVIEDINPSQAKQNPLKGKRKEALKIPPSPELNLKKKKGETSAPHSVEGELSFVTLDEIGEEEDAAAQALVTVDEVIDEEELNVEEMVKNSNSLLTLDELIDQDDCISHSEPKDVTVLSMAEEQDLQQERLVTVDEIGEVEESADIPFATLNSKRDEGTTVRDSIGFISSQMPEDPSTLVTVDEIQDDRSDFHLVTLDEVTEEDEESLADFKNLKEELNFVTVDEVGDEEDGDNDSKVVLAQGKIDLQTDKKGNRKRRAVDTKKTKLESFSQVGSGSETVTKDLKTMVERPTAVEEAELKDLEPDEKRKKTEDSSVGKSVTPDVSGDLDFLVPKAGFFCPICSLFYSDEKAMANHCKSKRHKQNTEKFMAKQRKEKEQNETEERSSR
ncbi:zinc finger protein 638 isoform X3 [Mesocricetus auratus]|uniref:Zinc finger protein 638 isoform X3 n=1 Tax=Mesocricetus auratus TaxID=10036 RepID=A0A1U8BQV8_MESAU|nr:zinc finger protein 638 isoform X3 [Mesocricetus auratus]